MTVAGDIVANLTVNSKGWSAGLKDAITPLAAFSTAVLGVTAAAIYKFTETGSAIDDMSQRTGVSAESLGGLSYAAKQTDTSLESLQAGLVKQSKFMDALSGGSSSATATMNRLGIGMDDLAGKTADEQFVVFADRLSKIESVGERSAIAMEVFGKGAVDLIPLLSEGGDGIQTMIDRAQKLGLIMSNEDVAAAAEFGDSLDELTMAGEMLLVRFVSPLVPMLTRGATFISNLVAENREWITTTVQAAGAVGLAIAGIKAVNMATQAYTKSVAILQSFSGPKGWAMLAAGAAIAGGALYALNEQQKSLNESFFDSADASAATTESTASMAYSAKQADTAFGSLQARLIAQSGFMEQVQRGSSTATATLDKLRLSAGDVVGKTAEQQLNVFTNALEKVDDVGKRSALSLQIFGSVNQSFLDSADASAATTQSTALMAYAAQQADTAFGSLQARLIAQSGFMEQVQRGSSTATATLDKLRLSAGDVVGKTAEQQLNVFTNALEKVDDVGKRSALSLQIFGKDAGSLKIESPFTKLETSISNFSKKVQPAVSTFVDLFADGIDFVAPYVEDFLTTSAHLLLNLADNAKTVFSGLTYGGEIVGKVAAGILRVGQLVLDPVGFVSWAFGAEEASTATRQLETSTASAAVAKAADTRAAERQAAAYKDLISRLKEADSVQLRLNKQLQTPAQQAIADAQQLAADWWKASRAGSELGMRFEDLKRLQAKTLEDKSGFSGMFTDVTDELRVLRGEITETELKFQQMAEFGVSDKQIQKLREANAERDQLLAEQQKTKDVESAAASRVANIQKTVRDSFATPLDDFIEKANAVTEAIQAGALTKAEGNAYLEAERKKLLDEQAKQNETPAQRKAALTEAISVNSEGANRMLVDLMNRKGGGQSLDEQRLAMERRNQKVAEQTLAVMEAVKENTSKPQLATKPFRAGAKG